MALLSRTVPGQIAGGKASRWLMAGSLVLLVALVVWWSILLGQLATESYDLAVQLHGEASEAASKLARRRTMIAWEGFAFSCIPVVLLVLAYRGSVREAQQQARIEAMFAASSHELKTPIAGLRALLETLSSGVLSSQDAGPHLERGLAACSRLESLAETVLVRQAVLVGASPVQRRNVSTWISEALAHHPPNAVAVDLGDVGEWELSLPENALRIVLDNLLDNAAKYAPGSPARLAVRRENGTLEFAVSDAGPGFSASEVAELFEPYRRGQAGQGRRGTGLGLFLARSIAEAMGGDLAAKSDGAGKGATFTLSLPESSP